MRRRTKRRRGGRTESTEDGRERFGKRHARINGVQRRGYNTRAQVQVYLRGVACV